MSAWNDYEARAAVRGKTKRAATLNRWVHFAERKQPDSLSYHTVLLDGVETNVMIINSDNLNQKYLYSMPGEELPCGGLLLWEDNYWLITELDAANEVYSRAKMLQCNYLLKWIDREHVIHEQWCIVEDGTKLKRITGLRNSLAYWKRYVKRTPLIAGNPLELRHQNGAANSRKRKRFENDADWAISSQASNRGRFNDYPGRGSRRITPKWGTLNRKCGMVKI